MKLYGFGPTHCEHSGKGRSDSWHLSEFRSQRLFACELRRGDTRLGPSVQDAAGVTLLNR